MLLLHIEGRGYGRRRRADRNGSEGRDGSRAAGNPCNIEALDSRLYNHVVIVLADIGCGVVGSVSVMEWLRLRKAIGRLEGLSLKISAGRGRGPGTILLRSWVGGSEGRSVGRRRGEVVMALRHPGFRGRVGGSERSKGRRQGRMLEVEAANIETEAYVEIEETKSKGGQVKGLL